MDKNLLKRALADSEEPTPGYMYRDIAQWTFLDQTTQGKLVAALMERLKPNCSVHVLAKTLRLVKHLCESGHANFQKEMQTQSETLKQFANFRGPQDAKYGDKLNEKVRTSAKEAVDAAFAPRKETKVAVSSQQGDSTWKEEKTSGFSTGTKVTASKSGDPHIGEMPTRNAYAEHLAKGGGPVREDGAFVKALKVGIESGFGFRQEGLKTADQRMREELASTGNYQAIDLHGGFNATSGGNTESSTTWKFTDDTAGGLSAPKESTRMLTPLQKEVEKLAAYKNTPQRVEITQFVDTVQAIIAEGSFSFSDLAEAMDALLAQKHPWQSRLNVLCAVEHIAKSKLSDEFIQYFVENPEDVQRNVHVVQASLKDRASKALKALGIPERTVGAGSGAAQQTTTLLSQGETHWSANVEAPSNTAVDFDGMSETAPRRRKAEKGEKPLALKKRATAQESQEAPSNSWGGGGGGSWQGEDAGASWGGAGTSGWGTSEWTQSAPHPTATAPPLQQPLQPQPIATSAQPARQYDEMDAFFGSAPVASPPAHGGGAWNAPSAQPAMVPQQQPQPKPTTAFDPLSLPAPPQQQTAPTTQPAPAVGPPPEMKLMEMLNQQLQQLRAAAGPNPTQEQFAMMQMCMSQQQQLMQQFLARQGTSPASPAPVQQPSAQRPQRADQDFALAAQQMRQQMVRQ